MIEKMNRADAQGAWVKLVDKGFSDYDKLSRDQLVWFNIESLTTDGVIDHYVNHGAEHNEDTIADLEFLGHYDIAKLLIDINRLFTDGHPPVDIDERNDQIGNWNGMNDSLLNDINDKFWKLSNALEKSRHDHISKTGIGIE